MINLNDVKILKEAFFELYPVNLLETPFKIQSYQLIQIQDWKTEFSKGDYSHYYYIELEFPTNVSFPTSHLYNFCDLSLYDIVYFKDPTSGSMSYKWTQSGNWQINLYVVPNYTYLAHERYIFPFFNILRSIPSWVMELKFNFAIVDGTYVTAFYRTVGPLRPGR